MLRAGNVASLDGHLLLNIILIFMIREFYIVRHRVFGVVVFAKKLPE